MFGITSQDGRHRGDTYDLALGQPRSSRHQHALRLYACKQCGPGDSREWPGRWRCYFRKPHPDIGNTLGHYERDHEFS